MIYYKKYKNTSKDSKKKYLNEKNKNKLVFPEHFLEIEKEFVLDLLYGFGVKTDLKNMLNLNLEQQEGGKKIKGDKFIKFIDTGGVHVYKIYEDIKDNNQTRILVVTLKDEECVSIIIDKTKKIAILHNMTYLEDCFMSFEGIKKGTGNKLLRFALNLILNYDVKRILLKDNSFLFCKSCSQTTKLAQLRIVTKGEPWYSKFGFKPYDPLKQKPSKDLIRSLETTNKILDKLKTLDINIIKLVAKKEKLKDINKEEIKRLINNYPMMKKFITRLADEYTKYCCILNHILKTLYNPETKLGITDFTGKTFYLDL